MLERDIMMNGFDQDIPFYYIDFKSLSYVYCFIDTRKSSQASRAHRIPMPVRIQMPASKRPVNCPAIRKMTGRIKKTAVCWDSSTLFAFAELFTIIVTAIRETDGEISSRIMIQLAPGKTRAPKSRYTSISKTSIIAKNEISETIILSRKAASTFALKICLRDRGQ